MGIQGFTDAELASLAPEERSALESAYADQGTEEALTELAADPPAEGGERPPADAAKPEGGEQPSPEAKADAEAKPEATTEQKAEPTEAPRPEVVTYRAEVGEVAKDIQAQKDAIKAARSEESEALKKLTSGEIDFDAYSAAKAKADAAIDAANEKLLEINRAQARSEVATELTAQQQQRAWKGMLDAYATQAKAAGLDYAANEALRTEFNTLVKVFASEADAKGMTDDNGMEASKWALDQAAAIMGLRHGKAPAATAPAATPAPTPAPAGPRHTVTTLGAMPAAAAAPVADDLMSKAASLEGEELETWMASLSKADFMRVTQGAQ